MSEQKVVKYDEELQDKEKKLKVKNKVATIIVFILIGVCFYVGYLSYTGVHDSWLFKNVLGIGDNQETVKVIKATPKPQKADTEQEEYIDAANKIVFKNLVDKGYTKYKFLLREDKWMMFETDLLGDNDSIEFDISSYVAEGETKVIKVTEYYGRLGELLSSKEEYMVITKTIKEI